MKKKPVEQLDLNGKVIDSFDSLAEAGEAIGVKPGSIQSAIKYNHVTKKQWRWRYTKTIQNK